jgi:osmotically-inducible protein OsmY
MILMIAPISRPGELIGQALRNDPRTQEAVIDVAMEQGIVTLSGRVKSEAVREAAEEIARNQTGVVTIINDLQVTAERY